MQPDRCQILRIDHTEYWLPGGNNVDLVDHVLQQSSRYPSPTMSRNNGEPRNQPFWISTRLNHERLRTAVPDQLTIDLRGGQHRQPLNEPASLLTIPVNITATSCHHDGQRFDIARSCRSYAERIVSTFGPGQRLKSHEISHATFNGVIAATFSRRARRSSRNS